jgi:hypothetical protein
VIGIVANARAESFEDPPEPADLLQPLDTAAVPGQVEPGASRGLAASRLLGPNSQRGDFGRGGLVGAGRFERPTPCAQVGWQEAAKAACFQLFAIKNLVLAC